MTIQQHKQLLKRMHIILVFLGASLALIAYLVFLNIRTLGVDAVGKSPCIGNGCHGNVQYSPTCVVSSSAPYRVNGSHFNTRAATGLVYRNGTQTGSFPINATKQSNNDYIFSNVEIPSSLYISPGTYTAKIKDGKTIDCSGSFNI